MALLYRGGRQQNERSLQQAMGDSSKPLARMMARFLACLLFASIMAPAWTSFCVASTEEDVSAGELVGEQTERPVISLPDVISDKPSAETAATEPALLRLTSTGEQTNIIAGEYISVGRFLKREYDDGDLLGYFSAVSGLACRAAVEGFLRAYEETRFAEEAVTSNGTAEVERAPWIPQLLSSTKVKRTFSLMRQQGRIFLTDARLMNMIFHIKAVTARLLRGSSAQRQFKNKATTFGYSTMCRRDCAEAITEHLSQTKIAPATSRKALQTDPLSRLQNDWRSIVLCNTGG
ncbi:hypothetical protein TGDOM2_309540 [Toxoplasma gondii GAB2-2007-GAL-DOM2]|uniref:Uncharacterized protein n=3 Tax=Toxoplasma gondii TaxID=5811 RepID=A0A086LGF0_TOXGO|nr:hypothetical protein TGDOM2_309540 [Toxoplasma gondii GAB2-2007-GAL-DOM2]KFG55718.1 hypothetical protein TGFOU_309540 [Toxoplasma gondii FOU]PUA92006.1 hypothetical protein TGBR9_309540 [Toxoplasma gondii TgCATBr9]